MNAARRPSGFTLIELLIAVALLAIMLTLAFAGLRFSSRSMERTEAAVEEMEALRIASTVVQRLVAQARPLPQEGTRRQAVFRGEADAVEFVAPVPVQEERLAGLYHYRLRFAPAADGVRLLLDYRTYLAGAPTDWDDAADSVVLMDGLGGGSFSYFGAAPEEAGGGWSARWVAQEELPHLLRLQLERHPGQSWPELVVPLHARRPH